jgi:hypothetical protein
MLFGVDSRRVNSGVRLLLNPMKPVIDIVAEPKGQTYIDLLNFAVSRCESFSLVWRKQFQFEPSAHQIANSLKPFLISNVRTDEWLGTKLIGHEAIVRQYRVSDKSIEILRSVSGLYSWLQPTLPEDLAFYSSGQVGWLASVSHERDAWFLDESLSLDEIYGHVSGIKIIKHKRS